MHERPGRQNVTPGAKYLLHPPTTKTWRPPPPPRKRRAADEPSRPPSRGCRGVNVHPQTAWTARAA
eukprot:7171404-Pyramimonas_sp.AAC.1